MKLISHYSKSICIAVFCAVFSMPCFCQSVTFMGIDINENFISFNQKLASKIGMGNEDTYDGHVNYSSTFAGINGCGVDVYRSTNGMVGSIHVFKTNRQHQLEFDLVNRIIDSYTNKYGAPYQITHPQKYPQSTIYNYKVGIHMIQIQVLVRDDGTIFWLHIYYYPKGYIDANSNVRINQNDI